MRNILAAGGLLGGLLASSLGGQVPKQDSRVQQVPHTKTRLEVPQYSSASAWQPRRTQLTRQILVAAGLDPMPSRTPLDSRICGRIEHGSYTIEHVLIETLPGYYLGGNLYRPVGRARRRPAVLSPHGHWKRGRLEHIPSYSVRALGINLARQGYVVFAYDMVGYNDTRQTPHDFGGRREQLWSFTPMGLQLWNSIRALDFLASLPDVDPRRIAATGASGGGTQTFLLAAVDERVRVAAPVNMVSATMQGGDPCEDAPGLRLGTSNVELTALIAPRPLLLVSATGDWTRNTPREEFPAIRGIYGLFGVPNLVRNAHFAAPHNYNRASREAVYAFLAEHLLADRPFPDLSDHEVPVDEDEDLLALREHSLPKEALDYDGVFSGWRALAQRQFEQTRDRDLVRERLINAMHVEWPSDVRFEIDGERITLSRANRGDRVGGLWFPGWGDPVLVAHPGGAEEASQSLDVRDRLRDGRPALLIDAFNTGSSEDSRPKGRYFLTYNLTAHTHRVQDILTALAFLKRHPGGTVELLGLDRAAVWSLFAAAVAPVRVTVAADLGNFRGSDEDFLNGFFVPGIQRAGGLRAATSLVAAGGATTPLTGRLSADLAKSRETTVQPGHDQATGKRFDPDQGRTCPTQMLSACRGSTY